MRKVDSSLIEELVEAALEDVLVTPEGLSMSRERAAKFLIVQATLTDYLRQIDEELVQNSALRDATFSDAIGKVKGANVTEKKINVSKDDGFMDAKKLCEKLEAEREWIRGHIKIFENAHLLYRSMSRE